MRPYRPVRPLRWVEMISVLSSDTALYKNLPCLLLIKLSPIYTSPRTKQNSKKQNYSCQYASMLFCHNLNALFTTSLAQCLVPSADEWEVL